MQGPAQVAIVAMPETTASVVYNMYDLFMSAGRDWGQIVDGRPGPSLIRPVVVSRLTGSFRAANGVLIEPQAPPTSRSTSTTSAFPSWPCRPVSRSTDA